MQQSLLKPKSFIFLSTIVFGMSLSVYLILIGLMQNRVQSQDARLQASISIYTCDDISSSPVEQCQVLYQLYQQTNGQNWYFNQEETRWFATTQLCDWTGITCNTNGQISKIELVSRNLVGNFPASDWRKLTSLTLLDLRANHRLTGSLSPIFESTTINTLLTASTNLCLPATLTDWYAQLAITDSLVACPVVSPTPEPPKPCNESCDDHGDCANNLMCYTIDDEQRCRLASNPTSDTCQSIPDQGLDFPCNHYCANTGECDSDLTCWYNRCRHPDNVSNESCQPPTAQIQAQIEANCNQVCSSNKNCAINMRCYNGVCRLATHPNNSRCQPIAPVITVGQTNSINLPKGGNPVDSSGSSSLSAETSVSAKPSPTSQLGRSPTPATPNLSTTPAVIPSPTSASTARPNQETALSALINNFKERIIANINLTKDQRQLKIGLGLIVGGIGLIILAVSLSRKKKPIVPKPASTVPPPSSMIAKAKQKNLL